MQQYANTIFLVSGPAKATKKVRELLPQHGFVENSIKGIFSGKTGPNNNEELLLAISILLGEGGKVLPLGISHQQLEQASRLAVRK